MTARYTQRGVSLIEMLVALTVFAAVSGATVGLMSIATNSEDRIKTISRDVAALERARSILRADLLQIVERPYREPDGAVTVPAFIGGEGGTNLLGPEGDEVYLMALVRGGWSNPGAFEPRASLQRVLYVYKDEKIIRRVRPFLDAAPGTPSRDQTLFDGVRDVEIAFFSGQWIPDLRQAGRGSAPKAIRLRFDHEDHGAMEQVFLVGGRDE